MRFILSVFCPDPFIFLKLGRAVDRGQGHEVNIAALLNNTVAALAAARYVDGSDARICIVNGTGTNPVCSSTARVFIFLHDGQIIKRTSWVRHWNCFRGSSSPFDLLPYLPPRAVVTTVPPFPLFPVHHAFQPPSRISYESLRLLLSPRSIPSLDEHISWPKW